MSVLKVRDAGNLLTRAGLTIPAVDVDEIVMRYSDPRRLVLHLRVTSSSKVLLHKEQYLVPSHVHVPWTLVAMSSTACHRV